MNKPKWLELIWLMCWLMPPLIVAAVISRFFALNVGGYIGVVGISLIGWFVPIIMWSRFTSSDSDNEHNPQKRG